MSKKVNIRELRVEDIPLSCTMIWIGPPGSGKCLGKGTPVLMYDGHIKNVEDIKEGEFLMGDDSKPRRVLTTTSGRDSLYKIIPEKGEPYIVNGPHILCLKREFMPYIKKCPEGHKVTWMKRNKRNFKIFPSDSYTSSKEFLNSLEEGKDYDRENILEIEVQKFIGYPEIIKEKYKGYKVGVEFPTTEVELPYCLGYFLSTPRKRDSEFSSLIYGILSSYKKRTNDPRPLNRLNLPFQKVLRKFDIMDEFNINEYIPHVYKCNSRKNRLELLAGILDANGYTCNHNRYYEICDNKETFIEDISFVARSLGYSCNIITNETQSGKKYHFKLIIYGKHLDQIPVKDKKVVSDVSVNSLIENIKIEPVGEGEYYGFTIDGNRRFLLGDFTVTHNTAGMETITYRLKHRYPVGRVFIGTEDGYRKFSNIFHPLFVSNYYDEEEEKNHILRQRTCEMDNGKGYPGNYAVNILDDISDDPKIFHTKVFQGLFKLGSQWWNQLCMVGLQYAIDMSPGIRKSVSYVAIGREPELKERKKLYENFGGMAGTFQDFCDLMDELTGDFTFIIFKKRSQTNNIEDNVFWFRTEKLKPWKFGCKEYREWGKNRYNPDYVEEFRM